MARLSSLTAVQRANRPCPSAATGDTRIRTISDTEKLDIGAYARSDCPPFTLGGDLCGRCLTATRRELTRRASANRNHFDYGWVASDTCWYLCSSGVERAE
jgi:hypothetical protein